MNKILPNIHQDFFPQEQHLLSIYLELMSLINVNKSQLLTGVMATLLFGIAI